MLQQDHAILRTDASGMPLEWIDFRRAVALQCLGQVAYCCGSHSIRVRGGINRLSGRRSGIDVSSIIATYGNNHAVSKIRESYVPPLHNLPLFQRDNYICLYCAERFPRKWLSRDHVTPLSQGGADSWSNVVTACVRCNNHKAGRTPQQAGMELIAVPFVPTHAEYVFLQGRRILVDQMEFLRAHFPRTSPLHQRT
jgi:5-methylcytosine-specific restriction endonuclease McrA